MSVLACDAARRLISPYLDGELVGEDRTAFQAHVDFCPACRRVLADEEAVVDAVRRAVVRPQASGRAARAGRRRCWPRPRGRLARGWIAAAAAVLLAGRQGAVARALPRAAGAARAGGAPTRATWPLLAADTHLRYTRGQLPLEVGSERPEVVSRWFSGRVPFNLTLPDYPVGPGERKPYHLLGGRLVSYRDDYAAYVAYRMDDRPISLLVTSAQLARPRGGETVALRLARLPPAVGERPEGHHLDGQGAHLRAGLRPLGERIAVLHGLPRLARGAPAHRGLLARSPT